MCTYQCHFFNVPRQQCCVSTENDTTTLRSLSRTVPCVGRCVPSIPARPGVWACCPPRPRHPRCTPEHTSLCPCWRQSKRIRARGCTQFLVRERQLSARAERSHGHGTAVCGRCDRCWEPHCCRRPHARGTRLQHRRSNRQRCLGRLCGCGGRVRVGGCAQQHYCHRCTTPLPRSISGVWWFWFWFWGVFFIRFRLILP